MVKFGSVFSGIEAASVAFKPFNWKASWLCEIDKFASEVLSHYYFDTPNHGDATLLPSKILAKEVEAPEVLVGGSPCFTKGHLVLTEYGYTPIENLKVGDKVVTHKGRLQKIIRVGSELKKVSKLYLNGNIPLICTPDHPFYAFEISKKHSNNFRHATISNPDWIPAEDMGKFYWSSLTSYEKLQSKLPETKMTQAQFMYLIGVFLGCGHIRINVEKNKKYAVLSIRDEESLSHLKSIIHLGHVVYRKEEEIFLSINDQKINQWIQEAFYHNGKIVIPFWMYSESQENKEALLNGYIYSKMKDNETKIELISENKEFTFGLADIAQSCGFFAKIKETNDGWPDFILTLKSSSKKHIFHKDYVLKKCKGFEQESFYEDKVYNIEVEIDNSYIVNSAIVHNCQAFSVAGKRLSLDDLRGNLTLTYCEVVDAIDTIRQSNGDDPCVVLWENVPGVLNTKDNAFGHFLGRLAGEDEALEPPGGKWTNAGCVLGPKRTIAWRVTDAQYFGVAQRRKRVFVVATARKDIDPQKILFEFEGVFRNSPPSRDERKDFTQSPFESFGATIFEPRSADGIPRIGSNQNICPTLNTMGGGQRQPCIAMEFNICVHGTQDPCTSNSTAFALGRNNGGENAVCIPINTMTCQGRPSDDLKPRMGLGIGNDGDPQNTITKAHPHAVAYTATSFAQYSEGVGTLRAHGGDLGGGSETLILGSGKDAIGTLGAAQGQKLWLGNQEAFSGDFHIIDVSREEYKEATKNIDEHTLLTFHSISQLGVNVFALQGNMIGRNDNAGPAGSGINEDICFTQTKADVHAVAYSFDAASSNSMKSKNPNSGCNQVDLSKTLDTSCLNPSCNQGGIAINHETYSVNENQRSELRLGDNINAITKGGGKPGQGYPCVLESTSSIAYNITFCDANGTRSDRPDGGLYVNETDISNSLTRAGVGTNIVQDADKIICGTQNDYCRDASENIAPTMRSGNGGGAINQVINGTENNKLHVRRLTPLECERLQGFPEVYKRSVFGGISDTVIHLDLERMIIHIITKEKILTYLISDLFDEDENYLPIFSFLLKPKFNPFNDLLTEYDDKFYQDALKKESEILKLIKKGSELTEEQVKMVYILAYGKLYKGLLKTECFDFNFEFFVSAGYTNIFPNGKETPDGSRYKTLGNSWAVPNVRWIGDRINQYLDFVKKR